MDTSEVDVQDGQDSGVVLRSPVRSEFGIRSPHIELWRGLVTGMAAGLRKAGRATRIIRRSWLRPLAAGSSARRRPLALEVEGDRGANQRLQGFCVDLLAFVDVDGPSHIPVEAGVEET